MDIDKLILKYIWKGKTPAIANTILKIRVRELTLPNYKTYHKAVILKIAWHWQNNRSVVQNREREIDTPHPQT